MSGGRSPRIAFLFTSGRKARLADAAPFPSEMFYGAIELRARGLDVTILEERDLIADRSWARIPLVARAGAASTKIFGVDLVRSAALAPMLSLLNGFDAIVTIATHHGLELGALRRTGLLRARHVAIVMGLLAIDGPRLHERRLDSCLASSEVVAISRSEEQLLGRRFRRPIHYVPFGVDTSFWSPGVASAGDPPYALSIGNDRHRDFELLVGAWDDALPPLKIVTSRRIHARHPRVAVIGGDWRDRVLSDEALRDLVRGAAFTIVPLVPSTQPSGQSVALQSMACGVPVVLTDTLGLWDRAVMRDGVACRLVPAGDAAALRAACGALAADGELRERLGRSGRAVVEERYTAEHLADAMLAVLQPTGRS